MSQKKKLSASEIVDILKNDIQANAGILKPENAPLAVASALVFSRTFRMGGLIYNDPPQAFDRNEKYMKRQAASLFRDRVDYFRTIEDLNRSVSSDSEIENAKITKLSPDNMIMAGMLVRMIAYDLIMLNVFHGIYSDRVAAPVKTWHDLMAGGDIVKSRALMEKFSRESDMGQTITGDIKNRNARFVLPAFCKK